jgi:hypothetical protein
MRTRTASPFLLRTRYSAQAPGLGSRSPSASSTAGLAKSGEGTAAVERCEDGATCAASMKSTRSKAVVSVASRPGQAPSHLLRAVSLVVYAGLAALGEALVARPALLFLRGLGLFHAVLPWRVPFGALQLILALGIALLTLLLAGRAALVRKPRMLLHAALLGLLASSFAVRSLAAEPRPPADPLPALLNGLRTAAEALDRSYAGAYAVDLELIDDALAQLPSPGFTRGGRLLPLHARRVFTLDTAGPMLHRFSGDEPGAIEIVLSSDKKSAWLTALSLSGFVRLGNGRVAVIESHGGTHSLPGRDPLVPAYPGMRSVTDSKP